ncbi:MAG: hypothetical protein IT258_03805 [Saprospiraceae bacterium]|nr:hypothetical protein [Saprospiraceae bacterium]
MRDWDLQVLFHFIRRTGMYTGASIDKDHKSIDLFLMAYEMGAMGECDFRQRLINQLASKYGVQCLSDGFPKQLEIASSRANQSIKDFFINESEEILIAESDKANQNRFVNHRRRKMIEQLEKFPEKININWVSNFATGVRELKDWKGVNLTIEELNKAEVLIEKTNELIAPLMMELVTVPAQITILKDELIELLRKNVKL